MRTREQVYTDLLMGSRDRSPLPSDGYKDAMAQAGVPLRDEVFYLHFRYSGPEGLYNPFDLEDVVYNLIPRAPTPDEERFLIRTGYAFTPAMVEALQGGLKVHAAPKGSWVKPNEPVLTVRGPSFLVSWLEPLLIALNYPMQIAVAIREGQRTFNVVCEEEGDIIGLMIEEAGEAGVTGLTDFVINIAEDYPSVVRQRIADVRDSLTDRDLSRVFEVGMRSMTCMAQHYIVLEQCRAMGILRTSNVKGAYDLGMTPVGTTGHEHQERWAVCGGGDAAGFRAIRDMRSGPPAYLFDTFNAIELGIPAAIEVMREDPTRACAVRFDSGDHLNQMALFVAARDDFGIDPTMIFMDGYDPKRTRQMERACERMGVPASRRQFGYGGFLADNGGEFTRSKVAMVYKLCQTGPMPVMKHCGTKSSLPGIPQLLVAPNGARFIIQQGESITPPSDAEPGMTYTSPETQRLVRICQDRDLKGGAL